MSAFAHKCKCAACGLHFTAYSWERGWTPRHCPECGEGIRFMTWIEEVPGEIYEYVPGKAELTSVP